MAAKPDGAAGGGGATCGGGAGRRVAFAIGTDSQIWPVEKKTTKIVVCAPGE